MTEAQAATPEPPSKRRLFQATVSAFIAASVILVTTVLPVEYGLDPLGTGKALGLLREPPEDQTIVVPQGKDMNSPIRLGDAMLYPRAYKVDAIELVLEPYDYVEYKYHLVQDAGMIFNWKASAALNHDFHGDPDANPEDVRTYDKSTKSSASGSIAAPVSGIHGWFWENTSNEPVTIKLASAGFYSYAVEFRSDKTKHRRELQDAPLPQSPTP
ncbi:MAG: hypothetical protein K2P94_17130 [Rhodospirillaceae bacterium]|nr:hypothetical protein [Rhodospirillaceae bacterium]